MIDIKELREEIESTRAIIQTYLDSSQDIDEMPSSEIMEFVNQEDEKNHDEFLIYWKDYKYLKGCLKGHLDEQANCKKIIEEFVLRIKEIMDEEIDFCHKADVLPSIHPRRVKEHIDTLAEEVYKKLEVKDDN